MSVAQSWQQSRTAQFTARWGPTGTLITVDGELDAANADQLAAYVNRRQPLPAGDPRPARPEVHWHRGLFDPAPDQRGVLGRAGVVGHGAEPGGVEVAARLRSGRHAPGDDAEGRAAARAAAGR